MRIPLRYGVNPHQIPAELLLPSVGSPIQILNGQPGYVNMLDALYSWQLVKELKEATNLPAASSYKKVSPAGTAVGYPLSEKLQQAYEAEGLDQSLLACAYLRARNTDRFITEGDFIALSDPMDSPTAQLITRSSTIGVIAPGYDPQTIDLLKKVKGEDFLIIEMDPSYEPELIERRTIYGIALHQVSNNIPITEELLSSIATLNKEISCETKRDMLVALITLKYTRSDAICMVYDGQTIGIGSGQQSRFRSAKLATNMAKSWMMRQHPRILTMNIPSYLSEVDKDIIINDFIERKFNRSDVYSWMKAFTGVTLATDGFISFRPHLEEARRIGVSYIIQPNEVKSGYSETISTCDELGMTLIMTDVRFCHH